MQLPIKAHYATLAMLALTERVEAREPLPARKIAEEHHIPGQFLGQILQQLRSAGLITSTRGANGGFLLQRPPDAISVAHVVDALCSPSTGIGADENSSSLSRTVHELWEELRIKQREVLENITLSDLLARSNGSTPMFYI